MIVVKDCEARKAITSRDYEQHRSSNPLEQSTRANVWTKNYV